MKVVIEFKRTAEVGGTKTWDNANLHTECDGRWFVVTQYLSKQSVAVERMVWIDAAEVSRAMLVSELAESAAR